MNLYTATNEEIALAIATSFAVLHERKLTIEQTTELLERARTRLKNSVQSIHAKQS